MPDRDDDRERTTPYGTPEPSDTTSEWTIPESTLRALRQRYDLLGELGRGGMGIVYRARDRETGDTVALKVLKPEIAARPDWIERFKAELLLARKITHKNVCRVYELNRFGAVSAISMEYVEGESLRAILERFGGVPLRRGLEWAGQICGGLAEAHAQGVIHRDLKPENILIDRKGQAKIMDFGIARSLESDATRTGTLIGTPAYMSPEQVEGKPPDARSDIYALGHILYEMFTGRRAFQAETPVALALKQIHETPPPPSAVEPHLPAFLDRAIQKCLEKAPPKRFQSVAELASALGEQQEVEPTVREAGAAEVPLPVHLARWQRSDWVLASVGVIAFALFMQLFDNVFPYGALRVPIGRSDAVSRAKSFVEKYAPEAKGDRYEVSLSGVILYFPETVLGNGLEDSLWLSREWGSWSVNGREKEKGKPRSHVNFDDRGEITGFVLPDPPEGIPPEPPSLAAVLPLATTYAEEIFRVKVGTVAPTAWVYEPRLKVWVPPDYKGGPLRAPVVWGKAIPVIWELPGDTPGTRIRISLHMYPKRIRSGWYSRQHKGIRVGLSPRPKMKNAWRTAIGVGKVPIGVLVLLCVTLFFVRRMYLKTKRIVDGITLVATASMLFVLWANMQPHNRLAEVWPRLVGALVFSSVVGVVLLSVAYDYLAKRLPVQLKALSDLLRLRARAQPAGLSIIRGVLMGFLYVMVHSSLLWAMGNRKMAAASTAWFEQLNAGDSSWAAPGAVGLSLVGTIVGTWLFVGLPLALLHRVTHRILVLSVSTALLWAGMAFSLPGASAFPTLPLYWFAALQGLLFSLVFLRYGLLTCMVSMFTVGTWLLSYPLFQLFGRAEPWPYGLAFVPWLLLVLLGAITWLRSQLAGAYRRVAAVFE